MAKRLQIRPQNLFRPIRLVKVQKRLQNARKEKETLDLQTHKQRVWKRYQSLPEDREEPRNQKEA